jgi:hypothetical protein
MTVPFTTALWMASIQKLAARSLGVAIDQF